MNDFYEILINVLKSNEKYFSTDGNLLRNAVYEDANKMDISLIRMLLSNADIKKRFFTDVDGTLIFDKQEFGFVINNREILPDSYTRFKNKIGLADKNGHLISGSSNVELIFPYKDCVLEGGQTKEDQKRSEIFYNETLAPDEVDRLLYPKAFCNTVRYTKDGVEEISEFNEDDNLIIKGNNLLVLQSLLKRYADKIKCIYIDPPYNTENDSFGYNDNFNHSTWLTFMKNRLEIAYKLLSNQGVLCVQCDDREQAYLKVLLDEIFARDGFLNCIAIKMSEASGVKMNNAKKRFPKLKEYILIYKKPGFEGFVEVDKYEQNEWDNENNIFIENITKEDREKLIELELKEENNDDDVLEANKILSKVKKIPLSERIKRENFTNENEEKQWLFANSYRIIKTAGSSSLARLLKSFDKIPNQDIAAALSKKGVLFFYITDFNRETTQPRLQVIFADANLFKNPCDFWQDIKTTGAIADEGGVALSNGKKPEKILYRLLKMITKPNDLILDFFAGTGTAGAVAHKMGRKYILVEQLNYIHDLPEARLKNVIAGDQTGISRVVNWQGGGSFVYCELAEQNQAFINRIQKSQTDNELAIILNEMVATGYISYKIKPSDIAENINDFNDLTIDDKKRFLMELQDSNLLYINYCDMNDSEFALSNKDKTFTKSFYKEA